MQGYSVTQVLSLISRDWECGGDCGCGGLCEGEGRDWLGAWVSCRVHNPPPLPRAALVIRCSGPTAARVPCGTAWPWLPETWCRLCCLLQALPGVVQGRKPSGTTGPFRLSPVGLAVLAGTPCCAGLDPASMEPAWGIWRQDLAQHKALSLRSVVGPQERLEQGPPHTCPPTCPHGTSSSSQRGLAAGTAAA